MRRALVISWLTLSVAVLFILITPFILSPESIRRITPACEWKVKYHRECALCGMTTSFILISNGRFAQAYLRNKGSIPLFAVFIGNQFFAFFFVQRRLKEPRHILNDASTVAAKNNPGPTQ